MQAIEFESIVQDRVIPLPQPQKLSPGQSVRVVVMYEEDRGAESSQFQHEAISRPGAEPVDRLAALDPHPDVLGSPSDDLACPSPWDETAWREKWGRS
ncbi:MAG: hypothetical protein Q8O33_09775 [Pseudomonadota bacterium]|nr:hypothetical protein [Pseudomonadota bacterium]